MRFRLRRGADLVRHTWDDIEFLVYDSSTGDTHLTNRVTSEALRLLEGSSRSTRELGQLVAESLGVDNEPDFEANIAKLVAHLDRIGLVEPES